MLAATRHRVPSRTSETVKRQIRQAAERRLAEAARRPETIDARLKDLDREWDIERAIEANASALAFTGIVLGTAVDRRWLAVPAVVAAFLFHHALRGWCPPVPILRRLGFRTSAEIEQERHALKALRGDYRRVDGAGDRAGAAINAARASDRAL